MKKENKTSIDIDEYNEGTPVDQIDKQNMAVVHNGLQYSMQATNVLLLFSCIKDYSLSLAMSPNSLFTSKV